MKTRGLSAVATFTSPAPSTSTEASSVWDVVAQAGPAVDMSADFICCGVHDGMALREQSGNAGDMGRREAGAVEHRELVARELRERRRQDLRSGRRDIRLQRVSEGRETPTT